MEGKIIPRKVSDIRVGDVYYALVRNPHIQEEGGHAFERRHARSQECKDRRARIPSQSYGGRKGLWPAMIVSCMIVEMVFVSTSY